MKKDKGSYKFGSKKELAALRKMVEGQQSEYYLRIAVYSDEDFLRRLHQETDRTDNEVF